MSENLWAGSEKITSKNKILNQVKLSNYYASFASEMLCLSEFRD